MYWTIIGFLIILTVCLVVVIQSLKKLLIEKVLSILQKGDFDSYFKILDSKAMCIFYAKFNRTYLILNGAIFQQNKELIDKTVDEFLSMRLNRKQEKAVYTNIFYYYSIEKDKDFSENLLKKIQRYRDDSLVNNFRQIYDDLGLKELN